MEGSNADERNRQLDRVFAAIYEIERQMRKVLKDAKRIAGGSDLLTSE